MEHSFPNIFYNNSFSEPVIEPSVATHQLTKTYLIHRNPLWYHLHRHQILTFLYQNLSRRLRNPRHPWETCERPWCMRQPPMVLSYYSLGDLIEMQAQINAINYCSSQPAFIPGGSFPFIPPLLQYLFQSSANYLPIQFYGQLAPVLVKPAPFNWYQYYGKLPIYGKRNL